MSVTEICNNCEHKPVCGKYVATGGHVKGCGHLKEDRRGKWIFKHDPIADPKKYFIRIVCSECNLHTGQKSNYCPQCGADMRGEGDGNHLL